jgi:hypothetical protein
MNELPLDTPLRRGPVLWRRSGGQIMVRRRGDDQVIVLAGTGVALWDGLREPTTIGSLASALAHAHDAGVDTVAADLRNALPSLIGDGVVEAR